MGVDERGGEQLEASVHIALECGGAWQERVPARAHQTSTVSPSSLHRTHTNIYCTNISCTNIYCTNIYCTNISSQDMRCAREPVAAAATTRRSTALAKPMPQVGSGGKATYIRHGGLSFVFACGLW